MTRISLILIRPIAVLSFLLSAIGVHAQFATYNWATAFRGSPLAFGREVVADADGNVFSTGHFEGTYDFDPGAGVLNLTSAGYDDIYVTRQDAAGNLSWAYSFGSAGTDIAYGLATDASGAVYITGNFADTVDFDPGPGVMELVAQGYRDAFLLKLDAAGALVWVRSFGGTYAGNLGTAITTDASGNIYSTGYFSRNTDFDPGPGMYLLDGGSRSDAYISKLNPAGEFIWAVRMGDAGTGSGSADVYPYAIAVDDSGIVYTTGWFTDSADFDPGPGVFMLPFSGVYDIYASRINADGSFGWALGIGSGSLDGGTDIKVSSSGKVFITGKFEETADFDPGSGLNNITSAGEEDVFLICMDPDGTQEWVKTLGGTQWDYASSMELDAAGSIYLSGRFEGNMDTDPGTGVATLTTAGSTDIFLLQLDSAGNYMGSLRIGSSSDDEAYGMAIGNDGSILVTGLFMGTTDFDPGPGVHTLSTSPGPVGAFVLSLQGAAVGAQPSQDPVRVSASPNPFTQQVTIETLHPDVNHNVTITSITGQIVSVMDFGPMATLNFSIPGPPGVYLATVTAANGGTVFCRLVKQ